MFQGEYHRVGAPGLHHEDCPGVTHSDELYFMWNPFYNVSYPLSDQDGEMSLKLTTMWTNFAKTGDPNLPVNPGTDCTWREQSQESREWVENSRRYIKE